MTESFGDSTRDGEWAAVRIVVDGDRIVEADAPGLDRSLAGLTLLEAAAVSGETLSVDALANALGPVFRAERSTGRIAVAMSGGVDSAVALLRALPNAIGVTLRLWLDPAGPSAERACCSPEAVIAARQTCHRLGIPHVTLDLREEFRAAIVSPFLDGYARGETPNPCIRCNGAFRFDELLEFTERAGCDRLATGHYARIVEHRGHTLLARAADAAKDQSYMLAALDPRHLARVWFPLGEQGKEETRDEAQRAGLEVPRRSEAPLPLAGDPGPRGPYGRRLRARARRARLRRRPGPGRCSLRRRRRRGLRDRERLVLAVGSPGMLVAAFTWGDLWRLALAVFLLAVRLATAHLLARLGGTAGRLSAFISGAEREILPVINKVGGSVDRVNSQLDKVDRMTDSAVDAVESVDTAVRTVSSAVTKPVQ